MEGAPKKTHNSLRKSKTTSCKASKKVKTGSIAASAGKIILEADADGGLEERRKVSFKDLFKDCWASQWMEGAEEDEVSDDDMAKEDADSP